MYHAIYPWRVPVTTLERCQPFEVTAKSQQMFSCYDLESF